LKEIADYGIGEGYSVSRERAQEAIITAARFVAVIEEILAGNDDPDTHDDRDRR
jgi:hypothetical protein